MEWHCGGFVLLHYCCNLDDSCHFFGLHQLDENVSTCQQYRRLSANEELQCGTVCHGQGRYRLPRYSPIFLAAKYPRICRYRYFNWSALWSTHTSKILKKTAERFSLRRPDIIVSIVHGVHATLWHSQSYIGDTRTRNLYKFTCTRNLQVDCIATCSNMQPDFSRASFLHEIEHILFDGGSSSIWWCCTRNLHQKFDASFLYKFLACMSPALVKGNSAISQYELCSRRRADKVSVQLPVWLVETVEMYHIQIR